MSDLFDKNSGKDNQRINRVWNKLTETDQTEILGTAMRGVEGTDIGAREAIKSAITTLLLSHTEEETRITGSASIKQRIVDTLDAQKITRDRYRHAARFGSYDPRANFSMHDTAGRNQPPDDGNPETPGKGGYRSK